MVPIGFVSDHVEVLWDLDVQATAQAAAVGLAVSRASTPGTDPRFVSMIRELVLERVEDGPASALSPLGPTWDTCRADCCPNPRGVRAGGLAGAVMTAAAQDDLLRLGPRGGPRRR